MRTAVDTSVLLDVFGADRVFGARSREALRSCIAGGSVVACEVVWAEVSSCFSSADEATEAMEKLGVEFGPIDRSVALVAGNCFRHYRGRGGRRIRIVADFLIGAHAREEADQLLSRDWGFYKAYFRGLTVLDPSGS